MIRGVHHVCISTPDIERAVAFYLKVIPGGEVAFSGELEGSTEFDNVLGLRGTVAKAAVLKAQNIFLEFFEFTAPDPKPVDPQRPVNDNGYTHFCFDVTDVDEEYERLGALGMTFHGPPQEFKEFGIRTVYGRDPDGNVVELQELNDRPDIALPGMSTTRD